MTHELSPEWGGVLLGASVLHLGSAVSFIFHTVSVKEVFIFKVLVSWLLKQAGMYGMWLQCCAFKSGPSIFSTSRLVLVQKYIIKYFGKRSADLTIY